MSRKNFNTTIDEQTIALIGRLAVNGKSKGEIVDMAIALLAAPKSNPNEEINRWFRETWKRLDELPDVLLAAKRAGLAGPAGDVPPLAASNISEGEFSVTCAHCGMGFFGTTKYASLCGICQSDGHRNVRPHDCRECQNATSI